jgi:hypothetical protein
MSTSSIPNLLVWLIIVVIFLVILFWILDRFLVIDGGILLYNANAEKSTAGEENYNSSSNDSNLSKALNKYCDDLDVEDDEGHLVIVCKPK